MGSNTARVGHSYRAAKPDMWYFDQLPPTARAALANANFNWSAGAVLNNWKRGKPGYKTGKDIADRVKFSDKQVIAKTKIRN